MSLPKAISVILLWLAALASLGAVLDGSLFVPIASLPFGFLLGWIIAEALDPRRRS